MAIPITAALSSLGIFTGNKYTARRHNERLVEAALSEKASD